MQSAAIVTYTTSGSTALRAARERPEQPILGLITRLAAARRLALVWGLHGVVCEDAHDIDEMVERACHHALEAGIAEPGSSLVITAGVPFGTPGSTNLLRIAWVRLSASPRTPRRASARGRSPSRPMAWRMKKPLSGGIRSTRPRPSSRARRSGSRSLANSRFRPSVIAIRASESNRRQRS